MNELAGCKYFLFHVLSFFLVSSVVPGIAFSQTERPRPVIQHELMVELFPAKSKIQIIDKILLEDLHSFAKPADKLFAFLVHAGGEVRVVEKNITLKKQNFEFAKQHFSQLISPSMTVGNVPVDVYSLDLSNANKQLTLEYERIINHRIESGGKEYERSISESSGLITPKGIFLAKESFWFPVFGEELLTFTLSVKLPATWKSVSQGERIYTEDNRDSHMDTWREVKPQDDIYLVAAEFTEYSQAAGSVNAMAFLRTTDDSLAQKYLDTTAQYLDMYRRLLGPYPYSKFALVENFWETGFGMPSFTLLGPRIIRFPFILHSSYPHELLHNWWGNSVFVNYREGNWAEGLTSYLADHLIKEQRAQGEKYRQSALQKYTNFANADNDFALKRFVSRTNAVTEAVGYGKTLMLFHMLRLQLGDDIFSQSLRTFYQKYRQKTASFSDVERVFSRVSGQELNGFFSQWIERVGAPNLTLKNVDVEALPSGKYQLRAEIEQTQAGAAYKLQLPIVVSLENKAIASQSIIQMENKSKTIELEFDENPLRIDIDPEFDVFRRLDINETPPAISQVFGAKKSMIILPSKAPEKMLLAYEQLAKNWQSTQQSDISIVYDKDVVHLPKNVAVWIIGWENIYRKNIHQALQVYSVNASEKNIKIGEQDMNPEKSSIVLVGRNPEQLTSAIAFVSADSAGAIPGLARKLPHYGKYSYLAFEGPEPSNVFKGQWPVVNSPLSFQFTEKQTPLANLKKRVPLASLAPVFSEKRLVAHVEKLASDEMQGRGLGSAGLDKAAAYIADQFQVAGLKTLMPNNSYFQEWQQKIEGKQGTLSLRNVIGYVPGSNQKYKNQAVVVSAHYDHLGLGWPDVRKGNEGKIHYGADDNASGVSILLELAQVLVKKGGVERSVIFIAFTGEEANRLGSRYFVKNVPKFPASDIFAAVNLDTVGRLGRHSLMVLGTGTASEWVHIFRGVGFVTGVKIKSLAKDFGSSDQTSFHEINVPAVQFFSGINRDFHNPSDTVDKIDGAGLVKVAVALKETVSYLAERELPLNNQLSTTETQQKQRKSGPGGGRRVSLGTVPDFAYQGEGVLISDVVPNSPAAKANVQAKDILIGLNGEVVKDLREFSMVLRGLKPGDEVTLTLLRNQQEISLKTRVIAR